jgi:hypothetical protein
LHISHFQDLNPGVPYSHLNQVTGIETGISRCFTLFFKIKVKRLLYSVSQDEGKNVKVLLTTSNGRKEAAEVKLRSF